MKHRWIILTLYSWVFWPFTAVAETPFFSTATKTDFGILVNSGRVSLDVKNADLSGLIREISKKAGIQITVGEGVGGKITAKFTGWTIEDTIKFLCNSHALVYEYLPVSKAYRVIQTSVFAGQDRKDRGITGHTVGADPEFPSLTGIRSASDQHSRGYQPEPTAVAATGNACRQIYKTGELLMRFKDSVDDPRVEALHLALGSRVVRRIARAGVQQVKIRNGWSESEAIAAYLTSGMVEQVERHALRYTDDTIPDDPYYSQLWWIENTRIHKAWDITTGDLNVLIAVIDTGVDYYHPDLAKNIAVNPGEIPWNGIDDDGNGYVDDVHGWDVAGNISDIQDPDFDPMDMDGHGTHVSGIIAAAGNNGLGISGVNWSASMVPIKVQANDAFAFDTADVIEAVYYAKDRGVRIVNCSFGGSAYSQFEFEAFDALRLNGILAVCAAGNDGVDTDVTPHYPSSYNLENIIAVAAGDSSDALASYSNFGVESVDVMAPGSGIHSTVPVYQLTEALVSAESGALLISANGMTHAGLTPESGISGLLIDCGDGNQQGDFPPGVNGNIALIQRGGETFGTKTRNAINSGATGAIIYNNVDGSFWGTLGTPGNWIPVVSVSDTDGQVLLAATDTSATLINNLTDRAENYDYMEGTSMAAPLVTGIAGLLLSAEPILGAADIRSAITNSADTIPALAGKVTTGGKVNALKALCSVTAVSGDMSGNGLQGLDDAILTLQIISNHTRLFLSPCLSEGVDVEGDGEVGIEEAIFILQTLAELR